MSGETERFRIAVADVDVDLEVERTPEGHVAVKFSAGSLDVRAVVPAADAWRIGHALRKASARSSFDPKGGGT